MLRNALILFVMVLIFGGGVIFTAPPVDGPGYALFATTAKIKMTALAVSSYAKEHLHIPSSTEGLQFLAKKSATGDEHPYLLEIPVDSWGHRLIYKVLDVNTQKFTVYSAGPDGIDNDGAGDDVVAGKKNYQCELYRSCRTAKDYIYIAFVLATLLTLLASIAVAIFSLSKANKARPPAPAQ